MCTEVYIAAKSDHNDLLVQNSPTGFWTSRLPTGPYVVRSIVESNIIYEVGSFLGCSCGLAFGGWSQNDPNEQHHHRIQNVIAFKDWLAQNVERILCVVTLENYRITKLDRFTRKVLDMNRITESMPEFSLDADSLYQIQKGS